MVLGSVIGTAICDHSSCGVRFAITIKVPTVGAIGGLALKVLVPVLPDPVTIKVIPVPATVGVTLIPIN